MLRCCVQSTYRPKLGIFRRFIHQKSRIIPPSCEPVLVISSEYHDPYLNLAYENWMYENLDFEKQDILFFWQNSRCVVIGRHQNPWLECDGRYLRENGIKLARRHSGGGTVYHDLGNLNITFFTSRARYNRRRNLASIAHALYDTWDLDVEISSRDDLLVDGLYKVSGSAAKLGKVSSYHHCTLLCNVNTDILQKAVTSPTSMVKSRSTQSVRSQVVNLMNVEPSFSFDETINGIVKAYCKSRNHSEIMSLEFLRQYSSKVDKMKLELRSWEWIYGKTPPFTLNHTLLVAPDTTITIALEVVTGIVKSIDLSRHEMFGGEELLQKYLVGVRFTEEDVGLAMKNCVENYPDLLDNRTRQYVHVIFKSILDKC